MGGFISFHELGSNTVRRLPILATVVVLGACGSDAATSTTPPTTLAPTTIGATTTTTVPDTTVPATTTTVSISRESRVALERCRGELGQFFASQVGELGGGKDQIDEAMAMCEEAGLQLDADNPPVGSVGRQLGLAVANVNVAISVAGLDVVLDQFDVDAQHKLQDAVDEFRATVDELLG